MSFVRFYGIFACLLLIISEVLLFSGNQFVGVWFYAFAWWPYIFFVDWLIKRKTGSSLIIDRTREFLALIPWSVFIWLIFEWFNLYLKNWHYINIIPEISWRWLGYFICYGTVLPGLFETYELILAYGLIKKGKVPPLKDARLAYPWFMLLGILFLILPVAYPLYFFPLVWGSFIFLLEPINHALGAPSLLREWEKGSFQKFYSLLLSGLICGFLWEFWNFWAVSKWVYTVPFVGEVKLFEMPVLGFLGFLPFTVECYVMMNFINIFRGGKTWEQNAPQPEISFKVPFLIWLIIHLAFYSFIFHQIDLHTVKTFLP
ncbi:hypothetical protein Thein_2204 [Thermodesulfatator indicus DSM 15286]|uniref:Uncharacterized protein n=1 Tax=Thermodesulfatator indicus (strain DSM 15286 / JCM 11887 / CIR29812) TaxID=667014 RepID=F8AA66_THEID|nr:hypothetical protein [Thermodesulfatator indicus]AEH46052.1 hypothetical protein Thein_2204 [Thermodesulfatator indicus DSM 15286]